MMDALPPTERGTGGRPLEPSLAPAAPKSTNRVLERGAVFPGARAILLIASVAYLAIAAVYGSRALDAVVTPLGLADTDRLAGYGKLIVATGFGLVALRALHMAPTAPRLRLPRWGTGTVGYCLVFGASMLGGIILAQNIDAAYLSMASSSVRTQALNDLLLVTAATVRSGSNTSEIATRAATSDGRAVLALRVLATGRMSDKEDDSPDVAAAIQSLIAQKIGTADQVFDHLFVPSVRSVRDAFNSYVTAQEELADAIRAIPQQEAEAWERYTEALAAEGLALGRLSPDDWPTAVGEAQKAGAPVAAQWKPTDKATFFVSVGTRLAAAAQAQYAARVTNLLGAPLPPGLNWKQFIAESSIQARWSKALGVPGTPLDPELDPERFRETVYSAMAAPIFGPLASLLSGAAPSNGNIKAVLRWHYVPSLAFVSVLLVSLPLLAFVGVDTLAVAGLSRRIRLEAAGGTVIAVFFTWVGANLVDPELGMGTTRFPLPAPLSFVIVRAAPPAHWAGDAIRVHLLGGFGFGYDEERASQADLGIPQLNELLNRS